MSTHIQELITNLYEQMLTEDRIDDHIAKHPDMADEIRQYSYIDPSPTKKFIPWLIKQHKQGTITPQTDKLADTLFAFDARPDVHGLKTHVSKSWHEIRSAVHEAMPQTKIHDGLKTIYSKDGVEVHHVMNQSALSDVYRHNSGALIGRSTNWEEAKREASPVLGHFDGNGALYTVHAPTSSFSQPGVDQSFPLAVKFKPNGKHEVFTKRDTSFTNGLSIDQAIYKWPHLKKAFRIAEKHYDGNPATRIAGTFQRGNGNEHDVSYALSTKNIGLGVAALQQPTVTSKHISTALSNKSPLAEFVRAEAARHPIATKEHLTTALSDSSHIVREAAIQNPNYKKFFPKGH